MKKIDIKVLKNLQIMEAISKSKGAIRTLYILYVQGESRFTKLKEYINESNGVYYPTLKRLIKMDIIEKTEYNKLYKLTDQGMKFGAMMFQGKI